MNTVKDATGIDTEEFFRRQEEKMDNVEKLREKFAKLILEETEDSPNGRMVVFIDDLDRLNPEVAVELLEVIKLFMDVKNCIFVLAIDYEVESYRLDSIIRETVADDIVDEDIDPLSDFISEMLSSNPRAYKRLANSFYLIKSVNETVNSNNGNEEKQIDNVLIFGSLCIQMCIPKLYQIIVSVSDEKKLKEVQSIETCEGLDEYLKKYNLDIKMDDEEKQDILRSMISFCSLLNSVQQNHKKLKDMHAHLSGILQMTAITSVVNSGETQKRAAAKKVNKVVVNGVEKNVGTPTDAIVHTYTTLLDGDMELIEEFRVREERILTYDESRTESFYRNKKVLVEKDGVKVFIGLSSSTNDKMKYVTKLCDFIAEKGKPAHVIWKDNEQVMYMHE